MQAPEAAPASINAETPIINQIIDAFGIAIYFALGVLAVWGIYNIILVLGSLKKASIKGRPNPLLKQIDPLLAQGSFDEAIAVCRSTKYKQTALGQLVSVALQNRAKSLGKIRQLLVSEFHTEIIAPMEIRLASIGTIVRMGPLIGLLGTVASMIGAFGRIGSSSKVNPTALAADIALALWATGGGLIIATPLMVIGNSVHARIRRLRDNTEQQLTDVFDLLEETNAIGQKVAAPSQARKPAGSAR
ncbi:MAG: MotA/TolQ/ExbB proton channel family protein [bacterium]